ncbi:MAG: ParB/RepB/Spo0J family partition protein [Anaerolineales bacterium]
MTRKSGLGRGLDALIPSGDKQATSGVLNIPVRRVSPNPRQPRTRFDPDEISELASSILEHGVIQPIIVSYDESTAQYTLVAGERRWKAAQHAGLEFIPALVREVSEQQQVELALIENVQRSDLNPLEAAEAYRQLNEDFGLSHEEISTRVGKSRAAVTNTLRLLKLPTEVKKSLIEDQISEGHARALLALPTAQAQSAALKTVLAKDLTVRQTEQLVKSLTGEKLEKAPKAAAPPEIIAIEEVLRTHLGTKVKVNQRQKGGTIVIHYFSSEELNSLLDLLIGQDQE